MKFKPGDRVIRTDCEWCNMKTGMIGTIKQHNARSYWDIEEFPGSGHDEKFLELTTITNTAYASIIAQIVAELKER